MSINSVTISGNLTRDAELKQPQSENGSAILDFGVAVNERRLNRQTEQWEDIPNFFDVSMFGKRAEGLAPHMKKGTKVVINGRLRYSQWEKEGQKRSKVSIVANDVDFMSSRNSNNDSGSSNGGGSQQSSAPASDFDEDVPF